VFFEEPFAKTIAVADANLPSGDAADLRDHLEDLRYHVALATEAERAAFDALRPKQWGVAHDGSAVYLIGFDPLNVVRRGDIAIREAATALDIGLQFTNRALAQGVGKSDVRWSMANRNRNVR
jgi:hypothetical protein